MPALLVLGVASCRSARDEALPGTLPGLNLDAALRRLANNRNVLRRLLVDFAHEHHADQHKIGQALVANQPDVAQRIAHTLKGLAGSMEATLLRDRAAAIEKALMAGDQDQARRLLPALGAALKAAGNTTSEIIVYPDAPHAFYADYRPSYRKEAAEDGWKQMQDWFKKHGVA